MILLFLPSLCFLCLRHKNMVKTKLFWLKNHLEHVIVYTSLITAKTSNVKKIKNLQNKNHLIG